MAGATHIMQRAITGSSADARDDIIILEFMEHGSLERWIAKAARQRRPFSEKFLWHVFNCCEFQSPGVQFQVTCQRMDLDACIHIKLTSYCRPVSSVQSLCCHGGTQPRKYDQPKNRGSSGAREYVSMLGTLRHRSLKHIGGKF